MIYLVGIALVSIVAVVGILVAVMYTWRKDVEKLGLLGAQKYLLEADKKQLETDLYEATNQRQKTDILYRDAIDKNTARDVAVAVDGDVFDVVGAFRHRLQDTLDLTKPKPAGAPSATTPEVQSTEVTKPARGRSGDKP